MKCFAEKVQFKVDEKSTTQGPEKKVTGNLQEESLKGSSLEKDDVAGEAVTEKITRNESEKTTKADEKVADVCEKESDSREKIENADDVRAVSDKDSAGMEQSAETLDALVRSASKLNATGTDACVSESDLLAREESCMETSDTDAIESDVRAETSKTGAVEASKTNAVETGKTDVIETGIVDFIDSSKVHAVTTDEYNPESIGDGEHVHGSFQIGTEPCSRDSLLESEPVASAGEIIEDELKCAETMMDTMDAATVVPGTDGEVNAQCRIDGLQKTESGADVVVGASDIDGGSAMGLRNETDLGTTNTHQVLVESENSRVGGEEKASNVEPSLLVTSDETGLESNEMESTGLENKPVRGADEKIEEQPDILITGDCFLYSLGFKFQIIKISFKSLIFV